MITIKAKNVHQGDSLLISWPGMDGELEYGVIDCSLDESFSNPLLDELKFREVKKLRFIILSHPHTDHFSGMIELLEYCEKNIEVEEFIHTAYLSSKFLKVSLQTDKEKDEFFTYSVNSESAKISWRYLGVMIDEFDQEIRENVKKVTVVGNEYSFKLNNDLSLQFKSPIHGKEIRKYIEKEFKLNDDGTIYTKDNNPAGNLLSSIVIISSDDFNILFCSDATKATFKRLRSFKMNNLKLFQIPHHGSVYNFDQEFWESSIQSNDIIGFVSAGNKYGHPNLETVEYFEDKCELHSTNFVNGYKEYHDISSSLSLEADSIHKTIERTRQIDESGNLNQRPNHEKCGEKTFIIYYDGRIETV